MRSAPTQHSFWRRKATTLVATLMARPLLKRCGMSARTTTHVACATLVSISLFGCAQSDASSPPYGEGDPMVAPTSTGAGGAILPSGSGGIPTQPVGGQVGAGGSTPV